MGWIHRKSREDSYDGDDITGGIYKWTMDALFGRRISPSRRFKEISQDDTNYKLRRDQYVPKKWDGMDYQPSGRTRSTSVSSNRSFLRRYDLLQDDDETRSESELESKELSDLRRYRRTLQQQQPLHGEAWDRNSRIPDDPSLHNDSTDTFSARRHKPRARDPKAKAYASDEKDSLKVSVPNLSDPLISKLFGRKVAQSPPPDLPGKFPSPFKQTFEPSKKTGSPPQTKDFTSDYLQLLEDLDLNGQKLKQLQTGIQQRHDDQQAREASYREKYVAMRQELIAELKQSKYLYDNYYKLYGKYKKLKTLAASQTDAQQRVRDLESQVVDASIERADQVRKLSETIFHLELKQQEEQARHEREKMRYQSRILELENLLRSRISDSPAKPTEHLPSHIHVHEPRLYTESFT
ncbi:LAME_0H14114g1_1 [Lachancea meyersii CBS 8951]|uniref:Spindle pole component BBP1 n=1 Tax=Lachancea meyersii CBS 8951 TaxID=1266667 RepID=A0A1G4KHL2_9SACH|nr:LAME_0H14114g1_1 [Lachancea meyersii CBS 8951]